MKKLVVALISVVLISLLFGCSDGNTTTKLENIAEKLQFNHDIYDNLYLPNQIEAVSISWVSSNTNILTHTGIVSRPTHDTGDQPVKLTATLMLNDASIEKVFNLTIKAYALDVEAYILTMLERFEINTEIEASMDLPIEIDDVSLTYSSSNPTYFSHTGDLLIRPSYFEEDLSLTLTVTGTFQDISVHKVFELTILKMPYQPISQITGFASLDFNQVFVDSDHPTYYQVYDERDFINALSQTGSNSANTIEIMNDLDLGYLHVKDKYPSESFDSNIFRSHQTPITHPTLMVTGVSRIQIRDRKDGTNYSSGLKIFSKHGAKLKHTTFLIKNSQYIVIENIEMDEIWEYDDSFDYDRNDWDYITIEDSHHVYISQLTLHQAYDGLIDIKGSSSNITITHSKFLATVNDFIETQIAYLEANKEQYPTYKQYRSMGLSMEDMTKLVSFQKKGHLIGSSEFAPGNPFFTVTLSYNYYHNILDRIPRLRGGDVHIYNIIHDASEAYVFKQYVKSTYGISFTNQGIVTTEGGAVMMENSIFRGIGVPIKNNQKGGDPLFTGKYLVIDSLYELEAYQQTSSSTDLNSIWKANDAPIVPFSFNNFDVMPYTYTLINVTALDDYFDTVQIGSYNNIN